MKAILTRLLLIGCAGLMGLFTGSRALADDPATQPSRGEANSRRPGPAMVVQRFREAVGKLDLSQDQQIKVKAILDQAAADGGKLAEQLLDMPPGQRLQQVMEFAKGIHDKLAEVLNDEQMKSLQRQYEAGQGAGGGVLAMLQAAAAQLDLSADQRQQIKDLIEKTQTRVAELRAAGENGTDLQQIRQDVRARLGEILTPDQIQSLTQMMQQRQQDQGAAGGAARPDMQDMQQNSPKAENNKRLPDGKAEPGDLKQSGPAAGSPAPSVALQQLNGRAFDPAAYKGRVIVLEFGSLSCPTFRDHAQQMESLRNSEGAKAFFMVVYTREAFPAGDKNVQRNKDQGISIPDPQTLEARKAMATQAAQQLKITLPMAVDSMDNAAANAYGLFPNGAAVIGKDGRIAAIEQWANPDSLRRAIDDASQK